MYRSLTVQFDDGSVLAAGSPADLAIHVGDACVLQNGRILDYGRVQTLAETDGDRVPDGTPVVLRRATLQDQTRHQENALHARMAMGVCVRKVEQHKLPLKIHQVRFSFDRTLLSITYVSDERVDYRQFLKDLSTELKTHIEMRPVGVRDVAARIGGLGWCGRTLCCASWLKRFEAVSVKMAKQQSLPMNPAAISGQCGRLKCCLRFEQAVYRDQVRELPEEGDEVETPEGRGVVVARDILRRRLTVRFGENHTGVWTAEDVTVRARRRGGSNGGQRERGDDRLPAGDEP
jgi:cell fate regulator YaaT (PSP1 superfamily)